MHIDLTGHHVDLSPALRDYVSSRLKKLERHFDRVSSAHVVLTVEKTQKKAEATVNAAGATLHADAVDTDMYAAIDALSDKLDRQVKRHKEKLTDHHEKKGGLKQRAVD